MTKQQGHKQRLKYCDLFIPPVSSELSNIWVAGDITSVFHLESLKLKNLYGKNIKCVLSIYDNNKQPLKDTNNSYYLKGGAVGREFNLGKIETDNYEDLDYKLEFPVSEFHLNRDVDNHLFCRVYITDADDGSSLYVSSYYPFEIKAKSQKFLSRVAVRLLYLNPLNPPVVIHQIPLCKTRPLNKAIIFTNLVRFLKKDGPLQCMRS